MHINQHKDLRIPPLPIRWLQKLRRKLFKVITPLTQGGIAGQASKIKVFALDKMADRYVKGELTPRVEL